ncbi:MAG: flagellar biosynthesis protein FlgE [Halomonadaceae bacterium]|nr:MAG: flagellar biosynthesis protein FlgE [Halomonadaceae bacterium]
MISNTLSGGLEGFNNGARGMQDAASRIARAGTGQDAPGAAADPTASRQGSSGSLIEPIVDLTVNQRLAEASLVVISTADEMLGSLIDTRA